MSGNPAADAALVRAERRLRIRRIARSAVLDLEFYSAEAGTVFRNRRAAATHFFDEGAAAGLSVTPLFQNEWYSFHTGRGGDSTFLSMFFGAEPAASSSPWFDASALPTRVPTMREALEAFLAHADANTPLPVHELCSGTPTLGEARRIAIDLTRWHRQRVQHTRPRLVESWTARAVETASSGPLVSIVLPVRNRPATVGAAIESVLAQTYPDWELIVVDDGSTDTTPDVVARYTAGDPRITLLRASAGGVSASRNIGLRAARGRYVAFLDSDNRWLPELLGASVAALERGDAVAVHSVVEMTDDEGIHRYLALDGGREDLLHGGNFVDLNTLVARRESIDRIGGFDESLRRWVDYDLVIRLSEIGRLELLPFVGVAYTASMDTGRISTVEVTGWEQRSLTKYLLDWRAIERDLPTRDGDLVSIVMLTYADWWASLRAVRALFADRDSTRFELVFLDNGSPAPVTGIIAAALSANPSIRLILRERNLNFALGADFAFASSRGARVVFLNNDTEVHQGWLPPLLAALDDGADAVQSIIEDPDGAVENAGFRLVDGEELPLPVVERPTTDRAIELPSAIALATRADLFAAVRGFDPLYTNGFEDVDLGLRMRSSGHGDFRVAAASVVTHLSRFSPGRFAAERGNIRLLNERRAAEQAAQAR
ncbi:glycosyltransferase involved in cell wall biosynthesis [Agromyces sp. 3263]|nr:glycosyltransferase involved in cell wall biosynthesis [Agromyces sp. 3263]